MGEIIPQAPAQTIRAVLEDNGEITPCELDSHGFTVDDDASAIVDSQTLSCRLRAGPMLSKSSTTKNGKTNSSEELFTTIWWINLVNYQLMGKTII